MLRPEEQPAEVSTNIEASTGVPGGAPETATPLDSSRQLVELLLSDPAYARLLNAQLQGLGTGLLHGYSADDVAKAFNPQPQIILVPVESTPVASPDPRLRPSSGGLWPRSATPYVPFIDPFCLLVNDTVAAGTHATQVARASYDRFTDEESRARRKALARGVVANVSVGVTVALQPVETGYQKLTPRGRALVGGSLLTALLLTGANVNHSGEEARPLMSRPTISQPHKLTTGQLSKVATFEPLPEIRKGNGK